MRVPSTPINGPCQEGLRSTDQSDQSVRISNEAAIALACKLLSYIWDVVRIRSFRLMKTDWRRNIALALASLLGALPGALSATDAGLRLSAPTWMGNRIRFIEQMPGGGDVDIAWQLPVVEWWLREHGFTESSVPFMHQALQS